MKKSMKLISIIVAAAVILIIIYFLDPQTQQDNEQLQTLQKQTNNEPNTPTSQDNNEQKKQEVSEPDTAEKPVDANLPDRNVTPKDSNQPNEKEQKKPEKSEEPEKPEETEDPNDPMEALNINNMEMKNIMAKLQEWTNMNIIPTKEAMNAKITVYTPKKLPRSKALQLIYSALKIQGYIVEQIDADTIIIKQITDAAKLSKVPIIDANTPLAAIQNKEEIVQKFFKLNNYTPSQMGQVLLQMLGEYGNISTDDDTQILGVIDTVRTLMRMELVIR
jgi:hypothetical protein